MKRRMEQLVNGRFEYEVPPLVVTEQEVTLTLDEGKNYRGELHAGAADGRRIKGFAVSDHPRIVLAQDRFAGSACTIVYGIDTEGLHGGDGIQGTIVLSTSIEEKIIPVTVKKSGVRSDPPEDISVRWMISRIWLHGISGRPFLSLQRMALRR